MGYMNDPKRVIHITLKRLREMNELEMYNFMSDEDINLFNKKSGIYGLIHNDKVVYVG